MKIDTKKRSVSLPESADMMMVDEVRQALVEMHGRSDKRATIDFSRTNVIDTSIVQLVASASKSFAGLKLTGLDGKPYAARLTALVEGAV
ncbi:MAG: hypothetical protein Q9M26_07590 [Mariprofundales bacterium]|nr:hypothetical protein [Mariprofundales bacterium]